MVYMVQNRETIGSPQMCIAINRYSSKYSIPTCDDRIVSDIVRSISALLLLTCHSMLPDREEVYCGDVYKVIRG